MVLKSTSTYCFDDENVKFWFAAICHLTLQLAGAIKF